MRKLFQYSLSGFFVGIKYVNNFIHTNLQKQFIIKFKKPKKIVLNTSDYWWMIPNVLTI